MNNSDFVWVLTDGTTGDYDIYKSKDSAIYGIIEGLRAANDGNPIPEEWVEDFCDMKTEEDMFQYLMERPDKASYFDYNVECRVVRD